VNPPTPTAPGDWYPGSLPSNIRLGEGALVETSYSFTRYRSTAEPGLVVGRGAALHAPQLDVGPAGRVIIGDFCLISSAHLICDREITIGPRSMLAWGVVLMDSYRLPGGSPPLHAAPITIGTNVWLGFESCVLPGVTIGDHAIVAARAVVDRDVPPLTVVAGNPARVVRHLQR
jgi:acetyltransferase-like isoleucine patch superfamily enzyme